MFGWVDCLIASMLWDADKVLLGIAVLTVVILIRRRHASTNAKHYRQK